MRTSQPRADEIYRLPAKEEVPMPGPIVFVNPDGVLNLGEDARDARGRTPYITPPVERRFAETLTALLAEAQAAVVFTSEWAQGLPPRRLATWVYTLGYGWPVAGRTPEFPGFHAERWWPTGTGTEIEAWLSTRKLFTGEDTPSFVILDTRMIGGKLAPRHVWTRAGEGLTNDRASHALEILRMPWRARSEPMRMR